MKSLPTKIIALVAMIGIYSISNADSGYRAVNSCMLNDGKTIDDVRVVNSKWVEFVNENVEGGDITSHIITSVVGDITPGKFQFVDYFPSLESWAAYLTAIESIAEGIAIDAEGREAADCTESQLYKAEES
ncbi:MAG TPA: hypothetical protein EYQ33_01285 [Gammaproteobacteria bacterium]|jgi:hypothetical protein|nr:hypothetical protein [Gammaproteobacteria bacterium]